jgi:diguanylate cyclase (GGDEF)-like protein
VNDDAPRRAVPGVWSGLLIGLAVVVAIAGYLAEPRAASRHEWAIVAVLAATALVATLAGRYVSPRRDGYAPPWDTDTVWLFPAAMLTPPAAFGPLILLSVAFTMTQRGNPVPWRIPAAAVTVVTTFAVRAAIHLVPGFFVAGLVGVAVMMIVGAAVAGPTAGVIGTPGAALLWHDLRWALVQLAAGLCGLLVAGAMVTDIRFGVVAAAPLLLVAFALRWPELDRTARTDAKTGLPNWEHWRERSQALLAGAALHQAPGAVMILDLDLFKNVNDEYGHLIGDQVLTTVAAVLRAQVRDADVIGRFGGEEFVVTASGVSPDEAVDLAERIRRAVAAVQHHATPSAAGQPARSFGVTCTIGIAAAGLHGYDLTTLTERADMALIAGKQAGRDRVMRADWVPGADQDSIAASRVDGRVRRWWAVARPGGQRRKVS